MAKNNFLAELTINLVHLEQVCWDYFNIRQD